MQLNEGPLNRRDAMTAETDQSQPLEDLSLNGDYVGGLFPRCSLCALRVSAVPWHTPPLNGYGQPGRGEGSAKWAARNRTEEAKAKVLARAINRAQRSLPEPNSSDESINSAPDRKSTRLNSSHLGISYA